MSEATITFRRPAVAASSGIVAALAFLLLAGCQQSACDSTQFSCNELANKPEWGALQYYEYRLRERPHDKLIIRFENAKGTGLTVLAFPKCNSAQGYVVVLANSQVSPKDKSMPQEPFNVSTEAQKMLQSDLDLTPEVKRLITGMAKGGK